MRTMTDIPKSANRKEIDYNLNNRIYEAVCASRDSEISGINPKTGEWFEGSHEDFLKFLGEDLK